MSQYSLYPGGGGVLLMRIIITTFLLLSGTQLQNTHYGYVICLGSICYTRSCSWRPFTGPNCGRIIDSAQMLINQPWMFMGFQPWVFLCVVLLLKILFSGFCADSSWDGIWFMMSWTALPSLKQCWISQQVYEWSSIIKGQSEQVWPSNQAFTPLSLPLLTRSWSIMGDGGFFNEGTSWVKTPYFLLLAFLFMLPPCDRGGRFWQSF